MKSFSKGLLTSAVLSALAPSLLSAAPLCYKATQIDSQISNPRLAYEAAGDTFVIGSHNANAARLNVNTNQVDDLSQYGLNQYNTVYDADSHGNLLVGSSNYSSSKILHADLTEDLAFRFATISFLLQGNGGAVNLTAMNNNGDIVGSAINSAGTHAIKVSGLMTPSVSFAEFSSRLSDSSLSVSETRRITDSGVILANMMHSNQSVGNALLIPDGSGNYIVKFGLSLPSSSFGFPRSILGMNNRGDVIGTAGLVPLDSSPAFYYPNGGSTRILPLVPDAVDAVAGQFLPNAIADNGIVVGSHGALIGKNSARGFVYNANTDEMLQLASILSDPALEYGRATSISKSGNTIITQWNNASYVLSRQFADFDGNGIVNVSDLFAYLNAFFSNSNDGDINGDGRLSMDDFFSFINSWFAPNPTVCAH